jgi:hypothetical protein
MKKNFFKPACCVMLFAIISAALAGPANGQARKTAADTLLDAYNVQWGS